MPKKASTLSAAIEQALNSVSEFFKVREKVDVQGLGHVDALSRRHGAKHLEHLINMVDIAEMSPVHLILQRHLDRFEESRVWWHGEHAHTHGNGSKGSMKGSTKHGSKKHSAKKGSKKGSHKSGGHNLSVLGVGDDADFHHKTQVGAIIIVVYHAVYLLFFFFFSSPSSSSFNLNYSSLRRICACVFVV